MSQHDFNIANQSFPATRADLNNALVALASNSSGDAEPATKYANQWWYETDTNTLKLRNEANDAWISIAVLDQSGNAVQSITTAGLTLGATAISATGAEINQLDAITRGSILYGNASGATARLAAGGAGTVLSSDGTDISWSAVGGGGSLALIQRTTISDDATVNFTLNESVYSGYIVYLHAVVTSTNNVFVGFRVSVDSGSNFLSASDSYYAFARTGTSAGDSTFIPITVMAQGDSNYYPALNAQVLMTEPYENTRTVMQVVTNMSSRQDANSYTTTSGGYTKAATQVNAIQVLATSGNLATGIISLYGLKK